MRCSTVIRRRKTEAGQSIIEGMLCLLFLCLVLFGLLQIFHISIAQVFTEYSAFYEARSACVGFAPYRVSRSARVAAIGASGHITQAGASGSPPSSIGGGEGNMIWDYKLGRRYIEYQYWNGADDDYHTVLSDSSHVESDMLTSSVTFTNYPLRFPMRSAFTSSESIDIHSSAAMIDYAGVYLE